MPEISLAKYGPVFEPLLDLNRPFPVGMGEPDQRVFEALTAITVESAFEHDRTVDQAAAACCLSGLWMFHGFLDQSHTISQDITNPTGSYWHGIVHRREGDFSNAKYWFRQVGEHPSFELLDERISDHDALLQNKKAAKLCVRGYDPFQFVDYCRAYAKGEEDLELYCREVTRQEWWTLFDYCYDTAVQ